MNLVLPEMGEGVIEATVSQWLVKVGDVVERMEPVVEVETDKVTTEIVADESGTITAILVEEGTTVAVGVALAEISTGAVEPTPILETAGEAKSVQSNGNGSSNHSENIVQGGQVFHSVTTVTRKIAGGRVSPVVARMAAEHELDLSKVTGTGKNGRITKRDVVAFLSAPSPVPHDQSPPYNQQPDQQPNQPVRNAPIANQTSSIDNRFIPLSPMRRAIAEHMVHSVQTSPHATTVHEVDFSAVMAHRKANKQAFADKGVNLTFTAYIMMAVAEALGKYPMANSSWSEHNGAAGIEFHQAINIGMATAVQDGAGLVVPVIKHAADYNLLGMARTVNGLATKARDNQLTAADMQGGTFTVTNHGVSGSLFATPIINQPQAGILGVGAIKKQVVVIEDEYGNDATAIRPLAYLSCSFDHRILDGVSADGFVAAVVHKLETWSTVR